MAEELLEKIPAEKCWAITAKSLTGLIVMRGSKYAPSFLGKDEGIFAPIWGWEKLLEIHVKTWGEDSKKFMPWVKERFNIPVEDATGAAKLIIVSGTLLLGAKDYEVEIIEESSEKAILRATKCAWMERYKELGVDPGLAICDKGGCHAWLESGLKAINPKFTHKLTKAMPRGDPYCEGIYEFKEG